MKEHQVILAVLDAVDVEHRRLAAGGPVRVDFWTRVADFTQEFVDRSHHGKEEDLLFPCLVECGIPARGGPLGVMRHEHVIGRELIQAIVRASVQLATGDLADAAHRYVCLERDHIEKEDNVLFEIARQALHPEHVQRLRDSFARFEAEQLRPGTSAEYRALAHQLCDETGVDFDLPRGRAWVGGFKR